MPWLRKSPRTLNYINTRLDQNIIKYLNTSTGSNKTQLTNNVSMVYEVNV